LPGKSGDAVVKKNLSLFFLNSSTTQPTFEVTTLLRFTNMLIIIQGGPKK